MYNTEHENGVLICSIHRTPISKSHGRFFCLKCQRNVNAMKTLKAKLVKADANRMVLNPEKIVFILDDGVTVPATLYSAALRNLVVSGMGYAEWPSHQQAAVYAQDENIKWKFVN